MFFRGGHLTKGRIAVFCITLLGFTAGTGIAYTEIKEGGVSSFFGAIGSLLSKIFNDEETSSPSPSSAPSRPLDVSSFITKVTSSIYDEGIFKAFGLVKEVYQWMLVQDNRNSLTTFIKNFWNYTFLKDFVFNFHLTVRSWLGILVDKRILLKFPDAIKKSIVLSKFLALLHDNKKKWGNAQMVNWLYFRFLINPRTTILMLTRGSKLGQKNIVKSLTCNGTSKSPKKPRVKPTALGYCFITFESEGGDRGKGGKKPIKWSLRNEVADYLLKGKTYRSK